MESDFASAWWCKGAHSQTICGAFFRPGDKAALQREKIETADHDSFFVDWMAGPDQSPLVIVLHGLGSSSEAKYVQSLLKKIQAQGWQAVVVNARGTFELNPLPVMDHSGRTGDLNQVIEAAIQRNKSQTIYLVGFSAGGNKVLKWLGEQGDKAPLQVKKAATVSAASDLAKAVGNLDRGFDKMVYTRMLLKNLKAHAVQKARQFPGLLDEKKINAAETFQIYDRVVTAPLAGFKDENEYWEQSSAGRSLDRITRPVLLIHARNDPFLHGDELALGKIEASPYLHLLMTKDGGHLGFVTGNVPFKTKPWLEDKIIDYFKAAENE